MLCKSHIYNISVSWEYSSMVHNHSIYNGHKIMKKKNNLSFALSSFNNYLKLILFWIYFPCLSYVRWALDHVIDNIMQRMFSYCIVLHVNIKLGRYLSFIQLFVVYTFFFFSFCCLKFWSILWSFIFRMRFYLTTVFHWQ